MSIKKKVTVFEKAAGYLRKVLKNPDRFRYGIDNIKINNDWVVTEQAMIREFGNSSKDHFNNRILRL